MKKIVTIIGARPQIIKAAALSRAVAKRRAEIVEVIVHTGQHYDQNMSEVFFDELSIPEPAYNLNAGSGKHGMQTAAMIQGIEAILEQEKPDAIVLYGDTNSTLAGAVAASKIHIPVVHIEAGLRSFNKQMPEEVNRIMCDHVSTLLFSPTITGVKNLEQEGFNLSANPPFSIDNPSVYHCGDVMYDNSIFFAEKAAGKKAIFESRGVKAGEYNLVTIHRNNNTDVPERMEAVFSALMHIIDYSGLFMILPLHPRTRKCMEQHLSQELFRQIANHEKLLIIEPASFLEMIALEQHAKMVITDSGGVQKEAYYFGKPCLILRAETEWIELIDLGAALICDADKTLIVENYKKLENIRLADMPKIYGDGNAAEFICNEIITQIK